MSPFTATASCWASGLHARPSGCWSFELTRLGAELVGLACAVGLAVAIAVPLGAALGEATGSELLMGSMTSPWSGMATATIVPSAEMAIGPSSGPSERGNGLSTEAPAFSQYQVPVPNSRTASSPESPGATPSVKNAGCAGGFANGLSAADACVRSSASTSYVVQQPTVRAT